MKCKICHSKITPAFKEIILSKYEVTFFQCESCGFLFSEEPYWLDEAYKSAITYSDTGIIVRNSQFSKITSVIIDIFFNRSGKFIDYAGGYGLFTRIMRDIGFDFYWTDKYCENLFARGFEHTESGTNKYELLTAFEVFEHLVNPEDELKQMLSFSRNIIFSTEILPTPLPNPKEWWYYNFVHGQHISFYTYQSLELLAKKMGLNFYSMKGIHIFTEKKMNEGFLKLIKKASLVFLFDVMRLRYKSRTFEDHLNIKKKSL